MSKPKVNPEFIVFLAFVSFTIIVLFGFALWTINSFKTDPSSVANRENCLRVKEGMSERDLLLVMGNPDEIIDKVKRLNNNQAETVRIYSYNNSSSEGTGFFIYLDSNNQVAYKNCNWD